MTAYTIYTTEITDKRLQSFPTTVDLHFPVLFIDTNIDHIKPYKNGHYDYCIKMGHFGLMQYGRKYAECLCKELGKSRLPEKAD